MPTMHAGPDAASVAIAAARFSAVGAVCALLNIAIVYIGTEWFGQPYWLAALATCGITIPISYLMHRSYSFGIETAAHWAEFGRFVLAQMSQFALGLLGLAALVEGLAMRPWLAMVTVTVVMLLYGFVASSAWVFRWLRPVTAAQGHGTSCAGGFQVLQVSAFFAGHGGGIEVVAHQLAYRLAPRLACDGGAVVWIAGGLASERPGPPWPQGLVCHHARNVDLLERRIGLPAPIWSLGAWRLLRHEIRQAQVVHLHDYLYFPTLLALWLAGRGGQRVVITQHIGDIPFRSPRARALLRWLNRTLGAWALGRADQVVFVGRPVQVYFDGLVRYRSPPLLIPNGVDHAIFNPAGREAPIEGVTRLLFVGRFVEKKGVALLRGCVDLPATRWTFVGWGPHSPTDWTPAHDNVHVPGRLPPSDVASQCRRADLLVLPSTGEGFPLVLQEALACGTPVLVSREVAEAFPVTDDRCVFSVELRVADPARALRDALQALLSDPQALRGASAAATMLSQQWSWERCTEHYHRVYDALSRASTVAHAQASHHQP